VTRALVPHAGGAVRLRSSDDLREMHRMLAAALGRRRDPADLALALALGDSCGMTVGESLSQIHLIDGKPTIGAAAQLALAHRAGLRTRWRETSSERAVLALWLDGPDGEPTLHAYTSEDAKRAGLWGRGQWSKYPAQMLRARCITDALRAHCPEVLGGAVYDPEELGGAPVTIDVEAPPDPTISATRVERVRERLGDRLGDVEAAFGRRVEEWRESDLHAVPVVLAGLPTAAQDAPDGGEE